MKTAFRVALIFLSYYSSAQKVEAEDGTLTGTTIASSREGFSGTGYVTGFDMNNDAVTVTVNISSGGLFNLWIGYAAPYGEKTNDIFINNSFAGSQVFLSINSFTEGKFGKVNLKQGTNTIKLVKNWGYFEVDYFRVEPAQRHEINQYPEELTNPNATYEAKILYRYLGDLYGHKIISGQQAGDGGAAEFNYIAQKTGRFPAIKGFDLMDYSPSRVKNGTSSQQTQQAIQWWNSGGIVSMMWHWNAPKDLINSEEQPWWRGFYTEATTFDISIAMKDATSEEYDLIIRDIDVIAEELKKLSTANMPVLWRPLHEAEGGWFWWGAKGPETCVWLWKLMYDRLTNHHQLDNLIWVWTGTNSPYALDWYPGNDYVDIIGADIYLEDKNYSANFSQFDEMVGIHEGEKIITLSETGTIPDPYALKNEKAAWSWFCVWSGDFIMDGNKNTVGHLVEVYNHEYVITFDELPDFYNYVSPQLPGDEVMALSDVLESVVVYPNPTHGELIIDAQETDLIKNLEVYTITGTKIFSENLSGMKSAIDLSSYPAGIYLVRITSTDESRLIKIRKL